MAIGDDGATRSPGAAAGAPAGWSARTWLAPATGDAMPLRASDTTGLCRACRARAERILVESSPTLRGGGAARHGTAGDAEGAVAHYLGLLAATTGALDLAAAHFETALRSAGPASASVLGAWAQLAYVRVLLARAAPGDAVRAARLLADLLALAPSAGGAAEVGASAPADTQRPAPVGERYTLRREGEYWALASAGPVSRARGMRGFEYMVELVRRPHRPVYVVELIRPVAAPSAMCAADAVEHGLRISGGEGGDEPLDRRARDEYRRRWQELLAEQAAAERDHDPGRAARAQREIDLLARELAAGAARRGRGVSSAQERARVNVRNCVSSALRVIRRHDEPLWRHLANAIKTGTFCVYEPDRAVEWDL